MSHLLYPFHGHLACFRVLAVVNSAAVNIGVHLYMYVSFQIVVFSGYMSRITIAGLIKKQYNPKALEKET